MGSVMSRARLRQVFRRHYGEAAKVARDLGLSQSTISGWLQGRITSTRIEEAMQKRALNLLHKDKKSDAISGHGGGAGMSAAEVFALVAAQYSDKPDDFKLSLGHHELPNAAKPLGMWNLPEFSAFVSITMREVREWAKQ